VCYFAKSTAKSLFSTVYAHYFAKSTAHFRVLGSSPNGQLYIDKMKSECQKRDRSSFLGPALIYYMLFILVGGSPPLLHSVAVKLETNQAACDPAAKVFGANNISFISDS